MMVTSGDRNFSQQAGIQIAATFISVGLGIVVGIVAGFITLCSYHLESNHHYLDEEYFELPAEELEKVYERNKRMSEKFDSARRKKVDQIPSSEQLGAKI